MVKRPVSPDPEDPTRIEAHSIFIAPKSGRRATMRRLLFPNFIEPGRPMRRNIVLGQRGPKAFLHLRHRGMVLGGLQVSAFRWDNQRTGRKDQQGKRSRPRMMCSLYEEVF